MFSWRTTHPVALKSIAKVPNQKVARRPKCFSFGFFFFFRRANSNLRDSLMVVFAQNSIFHWAVHQPIAVSRFEVTRGDSNRSLKNYGFLYDAIFLRTNHLACACAHEQGVKMAYSGELRTGSTWKQQKLYDFNSFCNLDMNQKLVSVMLIKSSYVGTVHNEIISPAHLSCLRVVAVNAHLLQH